ncbi:MAG: dynamin family protein, partial [Clostridia bacterium]|nr:dynamin family protein [Clostridia bacterium]
MENQYVNYQNMITTVMTGITGLEKICSHISMETQGEDLDKLGVKMKNHVFSVGIMGEFKRGKSTVINALLGQEIVPADIMPCSATLNYIRWD